MLHKFLKISRIRKLQKRFARTDFMLPTSKFRSFLLLTFPYFACLFYHLWIFRTFSIIPLKSTFNDIIKPWNVFFLLLRKQPASITTRTSRISLLLNDEHFLVCVHASCRILVLYLVLVLFLVGVLY